jgi:N-formylglutamate amidohydrolase
MSDWLQIHRGAAPLIIAVPHAGTLVPADYAAALVPERAILDTDWHVHRLYDFARDLGATLIRTDIARAVIDMNRDPSGASLYPGQATTELCPTTTFDGAPLHHPGMAPDEADVAARRERFHTPYHAAIRAEIARLRSAHAAVVLYDAHSIRSRVPRLFDGELPEFNIGSVGRTSCAPALVERIEMLARMSGRPTVVDGRFRGGWTTRHHGNPAAQVHAIQMELAQRAYLDEAAPERWDPARAAPVTAILAEFLAACLAFATNDSFGDQP